MVEVTNKENINFNNEWQLVVKCEGNLSKDAMACGKNYLIDKNDIQFLKNKYGDTIFAINCPCCNSRTEISCVKIPYSVRNYIQRKQCIEK